MPSLVLRLAARMLLASAIVFIAPFTSGAQTSDCCFTLHIGPSGGEIAAAIVGVAVVIGVSTYFLARAPRITGCVVSEGGALALQRSGSGEPLYMLEGQTTALHPGDRVKVVGRKHRNANRQQAVTVSRVAKVYGQCSAIGVSPAPI